MWLKADGHKTLGVSDSCLLESIDSLQEDCRMTLWLRFGMQFSPQETGAILNISEREQNRLVRRGLAELMTALGPSMSLHDIEREFKTCGMPHEKAPPGILRNITRPAQAKTRRASPYTVSGTRGKRARTEKHEEPPRKMTLGDRFSVEYN